MRLSCVYIFIHIYISTLRYRFTGKDTYVDSAEFECSSIHPVVVLLDNCIAAGCVSYVFHDVKMLIVQSLTLVSFMYP